jgi:hypothetical protein
VLVVVFWICYAAGGLGLKVVWLWPIASALKGTATPSLHRLNLHIYGSPGSWLSMETVFLTYYYSKLFSSYTRNKVSKVSQAHMRFYFFSFNTNLYSSNCGHMRSDIIILLLYNKLNELLYFPKKNALTNLGR